MKGMCAYNRRHVGYIVPTCWDAAPSKNQGWVIQRWFCMPVAFGMERLSIDPFVYSIYSYVYPDLHPPRTAQKQRYQLSHLSNTGIGWARWAAETTRAWLTSEVLNGVGPGWTSGLRPKAKLRKRRLQSQRLKEQPEAQGAVSHGKRWEKCAGNNF